MSRVRFCLSKRVARLASCRVDSSVERATRWRARCFLLPAPSSRSPLPTEMPPPMTCARERQQKGSRTEFAWLLERNWLAGQPGADRLCAEKVAAGRRRLVA